MSKCRDGLIRALGAGGMGVERYASRPWASVGACGEQHELVVRLPAGAADTVLSDLAAREFSLEGCFVADITALPIEESDGRRRLVIEALTIALD